MSVYEKSLNKEGIFDFSRLETVTADPRESARALVRALVEQSSPDRLGWCTTLEVLRESAPTLAARISLESPQTRPGDQVIFRYDESIVEFVAYAEYQPGCQEYPVYLTEEELLETLAALYTGPNHRGVYPCGSPY